MVMLKFSWFHRASICFCLLGFGGVPAFSRPVSLEPESVVLPLSPTSGRTFEVRWTYLSSEGPELDYNDIYVSTNGGAFGRWLNSFTQQVGNDVGC
jgi:hypothetical protein